MLIDTVGNGSGSYSTSKYTMSVQPGQYMIRQSRRFHPYFSGKCQVVEDTFDSFELQSGVVKRVGYFSSSHTGTLSTNYDGYWLESNGVSGTFYLMAHRSGVETVSVPMEQWTGYSKVQGYNWSNFTVMLSDFLWLGGAALNLSLKIGNEFACLHSVEYAGKHRDVFITSPNQPIRYEIRGISGAGTLRDICSQVGTEGSIAESGLSRWVDTGATGISLSGVGTTYPIKAIRKNDSFRDIAVAIIDTAIFVSSAADSIRWTLQINPILSAPLTYTGVTGSAVQEASGNGTITVTQAGFIVAGNFQSTDLISPTDTLKQNFLSYLGSTPLNVMDEYVLCATPISASTVFGGITYKEY